MFTRDSHVIKSENQGPSQQEKPTFSKSSPQPVIKETVWHAWGDNFPWKAPESPEEWNGEISVRSPVDAGFGFQLETRAATILALTNGSSLFS